MKARTLDTHRCQSNKLFEYGRRYPTRPLRKGLSCRVRYRHTWTSARSAPERDHTTTPEHSGSGSGSVLARLAGGSSMAADTGTGCTGTDRPCSWAAVVAGAERADAEAKSRQGVAVLEVGGEESNRINRIIE